MVAAIEWLHLMIQHENCGSSCPSCWFVVELIEKGRFPVHTEVKFNDIMIEYTYETKGAGDHR
jgi:hypothetical protein